MLCPCPHPCHFGPGDHHRAGRQRGRIPATPSVSPPLSSHRKVSKSVFTLSPCLYLCLHFLHESSHTKPALPRATRPCLQWEFEWKWNNNPHLGYSCGKTTSSSEEFGYNHIFILTSYLKHKKKVSLLLSCDILGRVPAKECLIKTLYFSIN